jgi:nucleotide-binding universal stress UspA family protein
MKMQVRELEPPVAAAVASAGAPRRILVAFDGSPGAWAALRQAIEIARREHSLLTIVGVVPEPPPVVACGLATVPYSRETLRRDAIRAMERELAAARDEVPATVSVTTRLLHGRPVRVLGRLVAGGEYDLVVTGPRPAGRLRALLGGSVTRALVARSPASVLAVRGA